MADPNHANPPFVPARTPDPIPTNPADGLKGLMVQPGGGQ
jgi:phospholipid/cholesterol/gamma-HCH transport system substrate-binding protein